MQNELNLSVNRHHKDKTVAKKRHYSTGFKPENVTIDGLTRFVSLGFAWSPAIYKGNYRSIDNFISAELVGVDIDQGLSLAEAIKHPFIKKYCLLIYTSPSHQKFKDGKPPCDRYRLIFQLPHPITDPDVYKHVVKLVCEAVGTYDEAATDAARYWCGNTQAHFISVNGEPIPLDLIKQAEEKATEEREASLKAQIEQENILNSVDPDLVKRTIKDILLNTQLIEPRRPGTGTYEESRNVVFALASVFERDEAIAIAEAWSPPFRYQNGYWNPTSIIDADIKNRGKKGKRFTAFNLFKLAVERGYNLPSELQKKEDFPAYLEKCRKAWINSKNFTPDKVIDNHPYIDFDIETDNLILCLKAGLGSGKTTLLLKWLHTIFKEDNCIGLGYRNSLILQTIEKHNAPLIQKIEQLEKEGKWDEARHLEKQLFNFLQKDGVIHNGLCLKVWSCIESAHHYNLNDFNDCVLVLDEITSVIKSLLFSSTVKKRAEKIELFREAVKRAKVVICLDGNLSDMYSDFLGKVDPSKKLLKVAAKNNIEPPKIKLLEGVLKEDEIKKKDYSLWLHQLFNVPETVCVASDSQILLESLDNMLKEQGRTGLRVDSTTISDEDVKEFMSNPDKWIEENNPDYILYSPTSESGLSIDIKGYFQSFYGFLFGVLDVDSSLQIIRRLRDISVKNYLWVNDFFINNEDTIRSPLPDIVEFYQRQLITRDIALILDNRVDIQSELLESMKKAIESDINKLSTKIMAQRNYEKSNFRECVYWALEQAGYEISDQITPEFEEDLKAQKDQLSSEKKAVKLKKSDDIFNASDEFIGKSHTVIEWDADYDKQCAIKKAKLIDRLPEINQTSVWNSDFIYQVLYQYPDFISQLETRYLLINPEKSERISQEKYHFNLMQGRRGKQLTPWKLKPIHLKVKTLQKIGIFDFIYEVIGEELTAESEPIERLFNICQKKAIWQALGRKPRIDRIKYVRWLLNQIGYDLNSSKVKRDGRVINIYTVACCPHKDLSSLIAPILDAIARRYDKDTDELNWDKKVIQVEPVARKQGEKINVKKSEEKVAEPINTSCLETVDVPPQMVRQKQEERQPDKMLQNAPKNEDKYLEIDPDFIQWVNHAETLDHFNDLLGILWGVSQQNEALYHSLWHHTFNAISQEARERINYWQAWLV